MSNDARRTVTEEERARIHAARAWGRMCALCGRELATDETVWLENVDVGRVCGAKARSWQAPVGRECASPETVRETEDEEPEPCAGCGRGVLGRAPTVRRQVVACSTRCRNRGGVQRGKGRRS